MSTPVRTARPPRSGGQEGIPRPTELGAAWAPDQRQQDTWTPRHGHPRGAGRRWSGRQAACAAVEPRGLRAGGESRPRGDHPGPGAGPAPGAAPVAPRPDGRLGVRVLPGAPAVMAFDLSTTPHSDITVQASGDGPVELRLSPHRSDLVFDSNDFDETIPGPWEWDVKRLAVSVLIAARSNGSCRPMRAARSSPPSAAIASRWLATGHALLDIWYDQTTAADIEAAIVEGSRTTQGINAKDARVRINAVFSKARPRTR